MLAKCRAYVRPTLHMLRCACNKCYHSIMFLWALLPSHTKLCISSFNVTMCAWQCSLVQHHSSNILTMHMVNQFCENLLGGGSFMKGKWSKMPFSSTARLSEKLISVSLAASCSCQVVTNFFFSRRFFQQSDHMLHFYEITHNRNSDQLFAFRVPIYVDGTYVYHEHVYLQVYNTYTCSSPGQPLPSLPYHIL